MNSTTICSSAADLQEFKEFSWLLAILFGLPACLIIVVTIVGNFMVLCFKAKVGKSQTSLLIWNLGLADFLVGIVVLPIGVAYVIGRRWAFGELMCKIWVSCDVIFCTASVVTLCIISLDRYIGVTRPLRYENLFIKKVFRSSELLCNLALYGIECIGNYTKLYIMETIL